MFKHSAHRDHDEFTRLLRPVYDRLYRFASALTRRPQETDDLVSETILKAYENFSSLRSKQAFLAFLFTTASRIHKKKKRKFFSFSDESDAFLVKSHDTAPDVSADIQFLYRALDKLPEAMKEAVILFEITGLSLEEIREIQGGSLSGVKSRVTRGRQRLAKLLGVQIRDKKFSLNKDSLAAGTDVNDAIDLQQQFSLP